MTGYAADDRKSGNESNGIEKEEGKVVMKIIRNSSSCWLTEEAVF